MNIASDNPAILLDRASRHYRDDEVRLALDLLDKVEHLSPQQAATAHLTALCIRRQGDIDGAIKAFGVALARAPNDLDIITDLGYTLAMRSRHADALTAFEFVIAAKPEKLLAQKGYVRALLALGRAGCAARHLADIEHIGIQDASYWNLRAVANDRLDQSSLAQRWFEKALEIDPENRDALLGLARLALSAGEHDASTLFQAALDRHPDDPDIIIGLAEASELVGEKQPCLVLAERLLRFPEWVEGQAVLMRMRFEASDPDYDRDMASACKRFPNNSALQLRYAELLAGADLQKEAAQVLADARALGEENPNLILKEAIYRGEAGELDHADALLRTLPNTDPAVMHMLARQLVRRGDAQGAEHLLNQIITSGNADGSIWALIGIVWRLLGDDRAEWLHGQDHLTMFRRIEMDDDKILQTTRFLRSLHKARNHPIGQSLRSGTQTRGRLFRRHELEAKNLLRLIGDVVQSHWNEMPAEDSAHPLLRYRNHRPQITGSWSVRLTGDGFHVAHIHPEGILSSASYWELAAGMSENEGILEIGRPPPDLKVDLDPVRTIVPKIGHLALFPSTLYHGTTRFGCGERITAAFDVVAG